jgi:hypothetical protein
VVARSVRERLGYARRAGLSGLPPLPHDQRTVECARGEYEKGARKSLFSYADGIGFARPADRLRHHSSNRGGTAGSNPGKCSLLQGKVAQALLQN